MYRFFLSVTSVLMYTMVAAKFNETVPSGQAFGAFAIGTGIFQVQNCFDYFDSKSYGINTGFLNNPVLSYSLTEPFEISALLEIQN